MIEYKMPSLGADMEAAILREWRVKPGDVVKRGDIIAEVETQKGLIEVEVFNEGKIEELLINKNEEVPVGSVMALIDPDKKEASVVSKKTKKSHPKPKIRIPSPQLDMSPVIEATRIKISPLARRTAEKNKIDFSVLKGSGEDGTILKNDIEKAMADKPVISESEVQVEKVENMRAAIASAMSKSNREIPHYYLEMKIDMSVALAWLEETNKQRSVRERILPVALLIKAVAKALQKVPEMNATWENGLQLKKGIHPGLAISLRNGGVIVPAIHDADKKKPWEIMEMLSDLIPRARAFQLKSSELSDSTITITSLGENGSEAVFGIIYPPLVALVGFGSIGEEPWAEKGMLGIRPVIKVTLAADHRATDGHIGDRFLKEIREQLLKPNEL